MKNLLYILILLLVVFQTSATTHYVANTETTIPALSLSTGDSILFECDGEYYGTLSVNTRNITIGSYGAGAKPIIHGWETMSSWTNEGGGIYSATTTADGHNCQVSLDGENVAMGMSEWGYHTGGNDSLLIDTGMVAFSQNLVGAELIVNTRDWAVERHIIERISEDTIETIGSYYYDPIAQAGDYDNWYFIQGSYYLLDSISEWYCSADSGKLYMYFGAENPDNYTVKISTIATILNITDENITISNLDIQGGYSYGIYESTGADSVTVDSCDISFCNVGIYIQRYKDSVMNCTFNDIANVCIYSKFSYTNYVYVGYCEVNNVAMIAGLIPAVNIAPNILGNGKCFSFQGNNITAEYNEIHNVGYDGIYFYADNVLVQNNYIDSTCLTLNDGGAIYTTGREYQNKIVRNNILRYGDKGIYLDEKTSNCRLENNFICDFNNFSITIHKGSLDTLIDNTIVDKGIKFNNSVTTATDLVDSNYVANNTILVPANETDAYYYYYTFYITSKSAGVSQADINDIDSNSYFMSDTSKSIAFLQGLSYPNQFKTFTEWQGYDNDANSTMRQYTTLEYYYNETLTNKVIDFDNYKKTDTEGNEYIDNITLLPFTSVVFVNSELWYNEKSLNGRFYIINGKYNALKIHE